MWCTALSWRLGATFRVIVAGSNGLWRALMNAILLCTFRQVTAVTSEFLDDSYDTENPMSPKNWVREKEFEWLFWYQISVMLGIILGTQTCCPVFLLWANFVDSLCSHIFSIFPPPSTTETGQLGTATRFTLDPRIWGDLKWRLQGKRSPRNWSKPISGPDSSIASIFWQAVTSEPPSDVTLHSGIRGKHAGSGANWARGWNTTIPRLLAKLLPSDWCALSNKFLEILLCSWCL